MNFPRLLGMAIDDVAEGTCTLTVRMRDDLKQRYGVMHGGVLATLVDSAVAFALYSLVTPGDEITTIEMKTNFLAPVRDGDVARAEARILKKGKSIAVGDVHVRNGAGELVGSGSATYMLLGPKGATRATRA
ncbi:MAG: PaaI family thioesterase [Planctomycetes bacterium]|nr:PaaI family thioesterase [Planctomycetota bacterium]